MTRIKFDLAAVQTIAYFEQMTHARLKDMVEVGDTLYFIVEPNELGRALGPRGLNVRKLQERLNKRIKMVEFHENKLQFIGNLCHPVIPSNVEEKGESVLVSAPDSQSRGFLIGRGASNLRAMETVAKRYFALKDIKVPEA